MKKDNCKNEAIDIVVPWVNNADPEWQKEHKRMVRRIRPDRTSDEEIRFQDWDNLRFWFRSIERCLPWINKIYFITCGHFPEWLNINHEKLRFIKHSDYIPEKYLPTFNSSTIEMNVHRIDELSNNYIMFNDDCFPLVPIKENYYFRDDKVCDEAVENIVIAAAFGPVGNMARYLQINNMMIINKYFKKREVQKKYPELWFGTDYGDRNERTESLRYWNDFPGFYDPHVPTPLKKNTLKKIWELEGGILDEASQNRFRAYNDVSHYLVRYWEICEGNIFPRRTEGKVFFANRNNCEEIASSIEKKKWPIISINEECTGKDFLYVKNTINKSLENVFPERSSYELE